MKRKYFLDRATKVNTESDLTFIHDLCSINHAPSQKNNISNISEEKNHTGCLHAPSVSSHVTSWCSPLCAFRIKFSSLQTELLYWLLLQISRSKENIQSQGTAWKKSLTHKMPLLRKLSFITFCHSFTVISLSFNRVAQHQIQTHFQSSS